MTLTIGLILFLFIRRVYFFVPKICISNRSHASLGGKYRRNLVTFKELSIFYTFVILYYLLDSFLILMLYVSQDSLRQDVVFLIYHSSCVVFDCIYLIILPLYVLKKTFAEFPEIWTDFTPVLYQFKMMGNVISPRREEEGDLKAVDAVAAVGVRRFQFVASVKETEGSGRRNVGRSRQSRHTRIQIENIPAQRSRFSMPDVVD